MKYYLDTEFSEHEKRFTTGLIFGGIPWRVPTIDLISIALVADDGREYYAESSEYDPDMCNPWVREHVLPQLGSPDQRKLRMTIRDEIRAFIGDDEKPEFWGYYADYDWVVFCWLYGRMVDLPKGWPMYCRDLQQLADGLGLVLSSPEDHHALRDARWVRGVHREIRGEDP